MLAALFWFGLASSAILAWTAPSLAAAVLILVAPWNLLTEAVGWDVRVFLALFLGVRTAYERWRTDENIVPPNGGKLWICFLAIATATLFLNLQDVPAEGAAAGKSIFLYLLAGSGAAFSIAQFTKGKLAIRRAATIFVISVTLASLVGLVEAISGYMSDEPVARIVGTLGNANYFATFLALASTVTVILLKLGVISRRIGVGCATLAAVVCFLTFSRMGTLACVSGLTLAYLIRPKTKLLSREIAIPFVAIAGLATLMVGTYMATLRHSLTFSPTDDDGTLATAVQAAEDLSRLQAFQYSVELAMEHTISGVGLGTFPFRNYVSNGIFTTTHNTWMQALVGTGICGLSCFVGALIQGLMRLRDEHRRMFLPAAFVVGLCSLFGDYLQSIEIFVVLAIAYASILRVSRDAEVQE